MKISSWFFNFSLGLMSTPLNNRTNFSLSPSSQNFDAVISTELSIYLSVFVGLFALVGTAFGLFQLIQISRSKTIRTYSNYMYYQMLYPCLISSLIDIPNFFFGMYFSWFFSSPIFCSIFAIQTYSTYGLLAYQLLWITLERHRYLFQLNQKISLRRQLFSLILIVSFAYICSICFVLLPRCFKSSPCQICFLENSSHTLLFTIYTFFFPLATMSVSTLILLRRLFYHRLQLSKGRRWFHLKRMFSHSIVYLGWFAFTYSPFTFYSLVISFDPQRFQSAALKSILYVLNMFGIQFLPILTCFLIETKNFSDQLCRFRRPKRIVERF